MRIGISTGRMVVGDAGPDDASDYKVLGDTVNLGARLESANKMTGTRILVSGRTTEMAGDRFLFRPIGKLRPADKSEGVMTYKPVSSRAAATEAQERVVRLSDAVVRAFDGGRFMDSLEAAKAMETELGPSRFITLYREQAGSRLEPGPNEQGDRSIVFIEK
jgi:hypothetical protein